MHKDPGSTDAFNALFVGTKWWVWLPKDILEFSSEYSCDPACSDEPVNHATRGGIWNLHILPQLRSRSFYGKRVTSGLQHEGETVFMPHGTDHSVYNLEETVAVGDNFVYDTAMEDLAANATVKRLDKIEAMIRNLDPQSERRATEALAQKEKAMKKLRKKKFKQNHSNAWNTQILKKNTF